MDWIAGTSGYSYKEWKGNFYPADITADEMLAFYASKLPGVEINNTFYRMPRSNVLETWRDAVPASFEFVIKASRRITHQAKLVDCEDSIDYLAKRLEILDDKLGCVLFQLPPFLRKDAARLSTFLKAWPNALPAAIEFRHASWFDEEIAEILTANETAIAVSEDGKLPMPEFFATTSWAYFRLRRPDYTDADLLAWRNRAIESNVSKVFTFFKHEDDGAGPAMARRFLDAKAPPRAAEKIARDVDDEASRQSG